MRRMYRSQWYRATVKRQHGGSFFAIFWHWLTRRYP